MVLSGVGLWLSVGLFWVSVGVWVCCGVAVGLSCCLWVSGGVCRGGSVGGVLSLVWCLVWQGVTLYAGFAGFL